MKIRLFIITLVVLFALLILSGATTRDLYYNILAHSASAERNLSRVSNQTDPPAFDFTRQWGGLGNGNGQFNHPVAVTVDTAGNVHVSDLDNHRIQKFTLAGDYLLQYGNEDGRYLDHPNGIERGPSGYLLVADTLQNRVLVYSPNGILIDQWDDNDSNGEWRIVYPWATTTTSIDMVFVLDRADCQVLRFYYNTSNYRGRLGAGCGSGPDELQEPSDLASWEHTFIYLADTGNHRVKKFNVDGERLFAWGGQGSEPGQLNRPGSLAVDAAGYVYVADTDNHRIQVFDADGNFVTMWGSQGSGPAQFNHPRGVAVDDQGCVYVADTGNHRVQKFCPTNPSPTVTSTFTPTPTSTATATPTATPATFECQNARVNDDTGSATQFSPDIAVDGAGNGYAVWQDERNGDPDVYFAYRAAGASWRPNIRVNDDTGTAWQGNPAIAVDEAGNAYAVWQDERNGNPDIYFAHRPAGGRWGANVQINDDVGTSRQEYPDIDVDDAGQAYAVWDDWRNGDADIYVAHRPAGGSWGSNELISDDTRGAEQKYPSITVDETGGVHVAWHDRRDLVSREWDIYYAYRPAGEDWSSNTRVNDDAGQAGQYYPTIAADAAGHAYVAWIDGRASNQSGEFDIYFAHRLAGGTWGPNIRVNDAALTASAYAYPDIAVDGAGNSYAVWRDERSGNPDIYRAHRPAGANWGANVRVNDDLGAARQGDPAVAVPDAGEPLMMWEDHRNGNYDIYSGCHTQDCALDADGVVLYAEPDYGGRCVTLTESIPNLADVDFDDVASSIRFVGHYATAWEAIVSEHYHHSGGFSSFFSDDPDFSDEEIGDDRASSVRLRPLTAAITGTVRSRHRYPIQGAEVSFRWPRASRTTFTDTAGRYELRGLPAEEVGTISVTKDGYQSVSQFASAPDSGESKRYDFTLLLDSDKQRLADRFAPALSLHSDESYEPRHVDIMVRRAALKERCYPSGELFPVHRTVAITGSLTIDALSSEYSGEPHCGSTVPGSKRFYFLDLPESENSDPAAYADAYREILATEPHRYPKLTYAQVINQGELGNDYPPAVTVQYWFFYYYNDSENLHEGDWEQITLAFDEQDGSIADILALDRQPAIARFASHYGGITRWWSDVPTVDSLHPKVYVARGSHASYPCECGWRVPHFLCPATNPFARAYDQCEDRSVEELEHPVSVVIPDTEEGSQWLNYKGRWGEYNEGIPFDDGSSSLPGRDAYDDPYCWAWHEGRFCNIRRQQMALNKAAQFASQDALAIQTEFDLPLEVQDSRGRRLTSETFEIPGAMFFDYGPRDGKLAIIPNSDPTETYTILLDGEAVGTRTDVSSTSTMSGDLTVAFLDSDAGLPRALQYRDVMLSSAVSRAEVQVQNGADMLLNIDQDGDGDFEVQRPPDVDRFERGETRLYLPLILNSVGH